MPGESFANQSICKTEKILWGFMFVNDSTWKFLARIYFRETKCIPFQTTYRVNTLQKRQSGLMKVINLVFSIPYLYQGLCYGLYSKPVEPHEIDYQKSIIQLIKAAKNECLMIFLMNVWWIYSHKYGLLCFDSLKAFLSMPSFNF